MHGFDPIDPHKEPEPYRAIQSHTEPKSQKENRFAVRDKEPATHQLFAPVIYQNLLPTSGIGVRPPNRPISVTSQRDQSA
jgi:hypothetical protein